MDSVIHLHFCRGWEGHSSPHRCPLTVDHQHWPYWHRPSLKDDPLGWWLVDYWMERKKL